MVEENHHHAEVKRELEKIKTREHSICSLLEQTKRAECISPVISPSIVSSPNSVTTGMSEESGMLMLPMLQMIYSDNNAIGRKTTSFEYPSFNSKLSEGEVDIDPGAYSDGEELILTPRRR